MQTAAQSSCGWAVGSWQCTHHSSLCCHSVVLTHVAPPAACAVARRRAFVSTPAANHTHVQSAAWAQCAWGAWGGGVCCCFAQHSCRSILAAQQCTFTAWRPAERRHQHTVRAPPVRAPACSQDLGQAEHRCAASASWHGKPDWLPALDTRHPTRSGVHHHQSCVVRPNRIPHHTLKPIITSHHITCTQRLTRTSSCRMHLTTA
jgi:hypothetical protein